MKILPNWFATAALILTMGTASAQDIDIDALLSRIDARTEKYSQLTEIVQGTDANRALAAFDAMVDTGDPTLIELAISAGMAATDERLRARALWEALSRKDAVTITVDSSGLDADRKAELNEWFGAVQTWPVYQKFADSQCVNLRSSRDCAQTASFSVGGLRVDMSANIGAGINGQFTLDASGGLSGQIMNPTSKSVYPARMEIR